jgi:putative flippase GtrA
MQVLLYFFIGFVSMIINLIVFIASTRLGMQLEPAIIISIIISAACNYLLSIAILFRHRARWNTFLEIFWYALCVLIAALADFTLTKLLIVNVWFFNAHWSFAKLISSCVGFVFNFFSRKILVFHERKKPPQK